MAGTANRCDRFLIMKRQTFQTPYHGKDFTIPIIFTVLASFLIFLSYRSVWNVFYLNDEWLQLGLVYAEGLFAGLRHYSLLELLAGRGRPIGTLINNLFMYYAPLSVWPFITFGLITHCINTVLVYWIMYILTRSQRTSFVSGIFFALSNVTFQTFAWPASTVQTSGSLMFLLISTLSAISYIWTLRFNRAVLAVLSFYVAFLIKDSSVYMILVFPILLLLFGKSKKISMNVMYFVIPFLAFGIFRSGIFSNTGIEVMMRSIRMYLINCAVFPIISLPHFLIPSRFMFRMAESFGKIFYPFLLSSDASAMLPKVTEYILSDMVSLYLGFTMLFGLSALYMYRKERRPAILFAVCFYVASLIPSIVYLNQRGSSYIESRYLYHSIVGISLLAGIVFDTLLIAVRKIHGVNRYVCTYIIIAATCLFFLKQISIIQREVNAVVLQSNDIKHVMYEIKRVKPTLQQNPIIYLDGDRNYYFYHSLKVPFQIGPGHMLALLYYSQDNISKDVLINMPFWKIDSQGYSESEGKGFGYYWDINVLIEQFRIDQRLNTGQLIGLYYNSQEGKIYDITEKIQSMIK